MDKDIVISFKTVLYTALFAGAAFLIYKLLPIISLVLFAALIVIAIEPAVHFFSRIEISSKKMPRSGAVLLAFSTVISIFIVTLTVGVPPVVSQVQKLFNTFDIKATQGIVEVFDALFSDLSRISDVLNNGSLQSVIDATRAVVSNLFTVITVLALSIYMSLDWPNIKKSTFSIIPPKYRDEVKSVFSEIEVSLGNWVNGQLMLMLFVGGLSAIGLALLGVDYVLALALISGLLEIVPLIGPFIATGFAVLVALSISPITALLTLAVFIVIQQIENNILVPKVMQKVSGFSPLVILIAVVAAGKLFGLGGAIVAIPFVMIISIIARHVWKASFLK